MVKSNMPIVDREVIRLIEQAVAAERERCTTATLTPMTLTPEQEAQLIPGKTAASIFPPRALVEVGWGIAMEFMRAAIRKGE